MKKIIAITAMAAMVAAAALADEPVAELGVELSGDATLTWGVDLDQGDTGFKNEANAKAVVTFVKEGTKSTEGDDVWAEVGVKFDGNLKYKLDGDGSDKFEKDGGKIALDVAKLHIGDLYIGLKSGDITVGEFKLPNAITAEALKLDNVGGKESQGLVAGYGTDDFGIAVDFRSLPESQGATEDVYVYTDGSTFYSSDKDTWDTFKEANPTAVLITTIKGDAGANDYYTNHYGLAAEAELKDSNSFVPGLFAKAGVSFAFGSEHQFNEGKNLGFGVSAGYKLPVGDTFYLKPAVAFTGSKDGDADMVSNLGASVLFGWGDTADANAGVYYLDNDDAKKVTPGVGVAFLMKDLSADPKVFEIVPSFYSGDIVPGLKAGVVGDIQMSTAEGADPVFGVAGGVSYELAVGDAIKVTPKAGFRFATENVAGSNYLAVIKHENKDNGNKNDIANADTTDDATNKGLLNFKAGVDISGLIENTTFGAYYQSRNLKALKDNGKAGTFNVFVKVSL
ncbi:MAG: hypothetical protein IKQ23_04125 [Treponema sp.]|nr:hypothetical protein [Treponema sp.]